MKKPCLCRVIASNRVAGLPSRSIIDQDIMARDQLARAIMEHRVDHIEQAAVLMRRNLEYGRAMNLDPRVRSVQLHRSLIDEASSLMRDELFRIHRLDPAVRPTERA